MGDQGPVAGCSKVSPGCLDDDQALALRLLDEAPEDAVLLLPCGLDNALRELEDRGLAEIKEVGGSIPLAHITPEGRRKARRG